MRVVDDLYGILGVGRNVPLQDIKRAYRDLALRCHPDRNPLGAPSFQRIAMAYEVLSDEQRRAVYDAQWSMQQRVQGGTSSARPQSAHAASARSTSTWSGTWRQPQATGYDCDPRPQPTATTTRPHSASYRPATFPTHYASSTGGFSSGAQAQKSAPPPPPPSTPSDPAATGHPSRASGSPIEGDSAESIDADRQRSQHVKRTPIVSAYNLSPEERERLQGMKDRFEACQEVDMTAWERIRKRPMSASVNRQPEFTAEPVNPPSQPPRAAAPPPSPPVAEEAKPASSRPASARPFPRAAAPPAPPAATNDRPEFERPRQAAPADVVGASTAPVQSQPARRPFSAGVHRCNAPTPSTSSTAASAQPEQQAPSAPAAQPTPRAAPRPSASIGDAFEVPSDKEISQMDQADLKKLSESLERKLRIVRQAALIKSLS